MTVKYAFRHFSRRPFANFLLIAQMIVIHLVVIAMISSLASRYDEYAPFENLLCGEGDYYVISNGANPDTGIISFGAEEIEEKLKGKSKVVCSYNTYPMVYRQNQWDSSLFNAIAYDDALIKAYHPQLLEGEWIDLQKDYGGFVPVVLSENDFGYRVGDHFTYSVFGEAENPLQAVVVGIIKDGAKILNPVSSQGLPITAHHFYMNYYSQIEEKVLIIAPVRQFVPKYGSQPNGIMIVQYPDGISEEDHTYNHDFLSRIGCLSSCDLPTLRKNTMQYIYEQCKNLLPIAVSVILLAMTSIVSMSALAAKRQLRDYAVYSLCGLPWRQCIWLHAQEMLISTVSAFLLTWCGLFFCKSLYQNTVIRVGIWQVLGSLLVALFCFFCSILLPWQLFRRNTTKTILQESED